MKLIAALLISASLLLGVAVPTIGALSVTTPGTTICAPDRALGGAVTAFTNITAHTDAPPLVFDFTDDCQ